MSGQDRSPLVLGRWPERSRRTVGDARGRIPRSMTACVAAILPALKKIVLASDDLISFEWIAAHGAMKLECLDVRERWNVMFAADDMRRVPSLLRSIRSALGSGETLDEVKAACREGYRREFADLFDTEVLRPWGLTREKFEAHGSAIFTAAGVRKIHKERAARHLGITLLVAGFDTDGTPAIFEVSESGHVLDEYGFNYHAIGSGASAALATLFQYPDLCGGLDLYEIIYPICAAMFAAAGANGVGSDVTIMCVGEDGGSRVMLGHGMAQLRDVSRKHRPPMPELARILLDAHFKDPRDFLTDAFDEYRRRRDEGK